MKKTKRMSLPQRQTEYNRLIQETRRMFDDLGLGAITSYKNVLKAMDVKTGKNKPSFQDIEKLQKLHKRSEMLKQAKVSLLYSKTKTAEDIELKTDIRNRLNEAIKKEKKKEKNKNVKDNVLRNAYRIIYAFVHSIEAVLIEIDSHEREYNWLSIVEQGARRGGYSLSKKINAVVDSDSYDLIIELSENITDYVSEHGSIDVYALYKEDQTEDISKQLFTKYEAIFEANQNFW